MNDEILKNQLTEILNMPDTSEINITKETENNTNNIINREDKEDNATNRDEDKDDLATRQSLASILNSNTDYHVDLKLPNEDVKKTTEDKSINNSDNNSVNRPINIPDTSLIHQYLDRNVYFKVYDKIAGLIYGCALGDCLGVTLEGKQLVDIQNSNMKPITDLPNSDYRGILKGDWSDDTDHLILLLDHLKDTKFNFSKQDYSKRLHHWNKHGFDDLGDQIGAGLDNYTRQVLSHNAFLSNPFDAVKQIHLLNEKSSPFNSSLTRTALLALHPDWMKLSMHLCAITHIDIRCIFVCWMYTALCRCLLKNIIPTDEYLFNCAPMYLKNSLLLDEFIKFQKIYTGNIDKMLKLLYLGDETGMRHVYKAFGAAYYMVRLIREAVKYNSHLDFKTVVLEIVNQGGDTDTNAALAGQVYGAYYGYRSLPVDWLNKLINKQWLDTKLIHFFELYKTL